MKQKRYASFLKSIGLIIGCTTCVGSAFGDAKTINDPAGNPPSAVIVPYHTPRNQIERNLQSVATDALQMRAGGGEVSWVVDVDYTEGKIFNPRTQSFDKVRLRSYQGPGVDPQIPFVAPTVNITPGETFRLTINNKLPGDDTSCKDVSDHNKPNCFNSTNMHTHGLWVNPSGNSDNVLIRINPGVSFTYEYNIPLDHPAGTFWYHPHLHGSTALQVSSGMAGALIIRGDRLPGAGRPGDVETLLKNLDESGFSERVLLFQQFPYACRDAGGEIKKDAANRWVCDPRDVGTIERYGDQFGPPVWRASGRHTSINGRVVPTFANAQVGEIERWRLIHAGVRDSIKLRFQKYSNPTSTVASTAAYTAATEQARAAFVDTNCAGDPVPQLSLAMDGLTRENLVSQTNSLLHPGYREDLLMVFPEPGTYCIIDADAPRNEAVNEQGKSRQLLGFVQVIEGDGLGGVGPVEYVKQRLIAAANEFMPDNVKSSIVADLEQRLGLSAFNPHRSLENVKPHGQQTLGFVISGGPAFQIGELDDQGNLKNPRSYDPERIDRNLELGTVDEWILKSFLGGHPFHIHVNPFQVMEVLDPDGNDVSGYDIGNTSPYARLKGVWKDTLFVTQTDDRKPYTIRVRSQYNLYIGDFVLHCHILDHEDKGMMQNVRISLPDGKGGLATNHH